MMQSLRLLLLLSLCSASAALAQSDARTDEWLKKPVGDREFETFRSFFAYDAKLPFDVKVLDSAETDGIRMVHLTYQSTPGVVVYAKLYEPASTSGKRSQAVVLLHGGVANGKDNVRVLGDFLAKAGWRVLAIDMPYFGERHTDLITSFTEAEKHEKLYNQSAAYLGWVTQLTKDVGRAFDLLVHQYAADSARLALVGYSRGAQAGMIVGAVEKRFAAVALMYGGHFDAKETGHLAAACPANYIGRIAPRPLFLLNGTQDADYFRETQVDPLHRLARNPKKVVWLETGHVFPNVEARTELAKWLQEMVR